MNQEAVRLRRTGRSTLSSRDIYSQVREMARSFEFKPGEKINEIELSRQLSVSRTPLREVLNQLMVEGYLTREANRGFVRRPLDAKAIYDVYEFRQELESTIARLACARATDGELAELKAFCEMSIDVEDDADAVRFLKLDEEFHMRLARMTQNSEYERALESVNDRIHYVRWIDMRNGRRKYTQNEHMSIVDALIARDAQAVEQRIRGHIERRMDQIVKTVREGYAEIYTRNFGQRVEEVSSD